MTAFLNKIPENYQGKPVDLNETTETDSLENARKIYQRSKKRLVNPPVWHTIAGALSAEFTIENKTDHQPERLLEEADFIRVNIHSPEALLGAKFDWVQVKEIYEEEVYTDEEYFLLRLEVAPNPNSTDENINHFFKEGASSTFVIYRKEKTITAFYFGRNEAPNTDKENSALENFRNEMIALGALAGLSDLQWKALLKALLQPEL